jgi:hypothetical protein
LSELQDSLDQGWRASMSANPEKPLKRSSTIGSLFRSKSGKSVKDGAKAADPAGEDDVRERRKSAAQVEDARDEEQKRQVAEAAIASEKAKLERDELGRIADAQAEEERKRRIADAQALEKGEEEERKRNRKSATDMMEAERSRRMQEGPQSPAAVQASEQARAVSQAEAVRVLPRPRFCTVRRSLETSSPVSAS